ncbi:hypothetical protein SDC9_65211 [bioreactor metagenome]|uniref:Uncharacterized protein n=1 Tax=bioreactor metagenome TaxID=1076179 RepID=A0A644XRN5_9ZZZZ
MVTLPPEASVIKHICTAALPILESSVYTPVPQIGADDPLGGSTKVTRSPISRPSALAVSDQSAEVYGTGARASSCAAPSYGSACSSSRSTHEQSKPKLSNNTRKPVKLNVRFSIVLPSLFHLRAHIVVAGDT